MTSSIVVTGNTAHTAPENRVFFPALDGLRAVAFLMVFLQHYLDLPWGNSGVNVFFVLSGFLITGILWDSRDDAHRARNFYVRRTLRIFPLYYGFFALLVFTTPVLHWHWTKYWITWPLYVGNFLRFLNPSSTQPLSALWYAADGHLRMIPCRLNDQIGMGHFWSLCVEEQFYLIWPWIVFFVRSRKVLISICASVVVLLPFVRFFMQSHLPLWMLNSEIFYRLTPFEADSLLLGALIALLWRGDARQTMLSVTQKLTPGVVLICLAAYLWTMAHSPSPLVFKFPAWRWTFGLTLTNVVSGMILLCALRPGTWVSRILSVSWLRGIGRISYGAYIFHGMYPGWIVNLFVLLFPHFCAVHNRLTRVGVNVFGLLFTLLLAWLCFRFLETPFLNLKEKWTSRSA